VIDAFPAPDPAQDIRLFLQPVVWDDDGDGLADDLVGPPAEDALGGAIPRLNDAFECLAEMASSEDSMMAARCARAAERSGSSGLWFSMERSRCASGVDRAPSGFDGARGRRLSRAKASRAGSCCVRGLRSHLLAIRGLVLAASSDTQWHFAMPPANQATHELPELPLAAALPGGRVQSAEPGRTRRI